MAACRFCLLFLADVWRYMILWQWQCGKQNFRSTHPNVYYILYKILLAHAIFFLLRKCSRYLSLKSVLKITLSKLQLFPSLGFMSWKPASFCLPAHAVAISDCGSISSVIEPVERPDWEAENTDLGKIQTSVDIWVETFANIDEILGEISNWGLAGCNQSHHHLCLGLEG